ncbi:O-antigen ligase family protein [Ruminiclostridium cellobioparum]|jgi:O-antigen ligase|uniref:O-antigen ligase family protein n=1 Tax=Ruminiclostridium cellobioparum TaxID=29355 RepID=UPI0028B145A4|nr:O-antigen ligase family protein [Ruminiclostridium cellobioparum]
MQKKAIKEEAHSYFKLLPIGLILAIVPIIVFMKNINLDESFAKIWRGQTSEVDFFSYYKMIWFITLTCISIISFFIYISIKKIKLNLQKMFIPLGIYTVLAFLSSSFSEHQEQAFFGFPERYEGFFTIFCYIAVCFICSILISSEFDIKYLSYFLAFSVLILSLTGITQFLGFDFFQSDFGKKLILPKASENLAASLDFRFPKQYIYSTLFNPNYVGGFFAIILSICIVIFISADKLKLKIVSGIFCIFAFINLLGSLSSTGLISMLASGIVILVLMRKNLIKNILPILALLICIIATAFFMNYSSEGKVFNELKIASNLNYSDIKDKFMAFTTPKTYKPTINNTLMLMSVDQNSITKIVDESKMNTSSLLALNDPSSSTPTSGNLTDIKIDRNSLYLYTSDTDALVVGFDPATSKLTFLDTNNKTLEMSVSNKDNTTNVSFIDPKFNSIKILINKTILTIQTMNTTFSVINTEEGFKMVTPAGNVTDIIKAQSFGFQGKENWGSNRGYIWSRSIPLVKDTILLGHGPDTFAMYFPQNDYVAKMKFMESIFTVVDKPHNMYLQIAINTGVFSLLAFLIFIGWYFIHSLKLYFRGIFNQYSASGVACLAAVTSFLVSSLANDSTISVSLTFWIILGVGISCNRLYAKSINSNRPK